MATRSPPRTPCLFWPRAVSLGFWHRCRPVGHPADPVQQQHRPDPLQPAPAGLLQELHLWPGGRRRYQGWPPGHDRGPDSLPTRTTPVGVAQQAGLPPGFITTTELTTLMGQDVSTSELDAPHHPGLSRQPSRPRPTCSSSSRTTTGLPWRTRRLLPRPPPALPLLQQQFTAAQIGSQATRTGYGALDQATAMRLAQQGVTDAQAKTGFTDLATQAPLFNPLLGSGEQAIAQEIQLGPSSGATPRTPGHPLAPSSAWPPSRGTTTSLRPRTRESRALARCSATVQQGSNAHHGG